MKYKFFKSRVHGIGCQTLEEIKENELISIEPMIELESNSLGTKSKIRNYVWGSKKKKNVVYLINGLGSYCNHKEESNLIIKIDEDNLACEYRAKKDIKAGEELFVNYGKNWFEKRKKEEKVKPKRQHSKPFRMFKIH
jgi:SET domain-containing protein|tara:strand:+ start:164 stop:577 length:414 start_codon:yes stop_codon:yes gene_type:complete